MIGQMAVRVTADRANFPLGTLFIRAGSAANVALMGVPVRAGVDVESITVRVENVDGTTTDFAARQYGCVWVVDLPASHFATVGSVVNGVTVFATGTGADGETERTWNIGIGNLEVLPSDADAPAPTPGATFWPLRMFDAAPDSPTKYNAYLDGSDLKIWNGTAWVTISGGSLAVDDMVTRTGENPVKSSGIWSAIWGALASLPSSFASLYDWCVAQLAGKLSTSGGTMTGDIDFISSARIQEQVAGLSIKGIGSPPNVEYWEFFTGTPDTVVRAKELAGKQDALSAQQLANIAAVPGKASAADLRYRIAEAAVRKTLPADCFPVTFTNEGVSYSINSLVNEEEASAAGDMFIMVNENDYSLTMVKSPATGSEKMGVVEVATFSAGGVYVTGEADLQFGGVSPVADTSPTLADIQTLADRTVNLITAGSGTASIDIELPELANVGRMRDFYVRLTVSATSASTWTIGQGESWDAMGSPPSSFAAGTYLYHISEVAAGVWHAEDMFAVAGKMPMYPMVAVTPSNGTLTVTPYTVATYTAGDSAAAFTVAVGTGTSGVARDCELVIDCTATGAVAPTVTWPSTFHPRTDAEDFACDAGVRNVYYISEYATGEFVVGGWQETTGGNA